MKHLIYTILCFHKVLEQLEEEKKGEKGDAESAAAPEAEKSSRDKTVRSPKL